MATTTDPIRPLFRLSLLTLLVLGIYLAAFVGAVAMARHYIGTLETRNLADFDIFHLAGGLAWEGALDAAYRSREFFALQAEVAGTRGFMTWSYPPQFGLVAAALALMPAWLAFLAFTGVTLAAYLVLLGRIAGAHLPAVLLTLLPVVAIGVLTGQNGFLTGSLVGLFALLARRGARGAGLPLGLMVIKPHLALGLGLYLLLSRRWRWTAQALAVVAGSALLCTLLFGLRVWPAFLEGMAESKAVLAAGSYSLHRMTSAYALLRSLGLGPDLALGLHLAVALGALALVGAAVGRGWAAERALACATLASLLVSPYVHDYDLTILGVALALMARDLAAAPARRLFPLVLGLAWGAAFYTYGTGWVVHRSFVAGADLALENRPPALGGLAALALVLLLVLILHRAQRQEDRGRSRGPEGEIRHDVAPGARIAEGQPA